MTERLTRMLKGFWVRAAISVGLVWWIFQSVDAGEVWVIVRSCRWGFMAAAVPFFLLNRVLTSSKWKVLLAAKGVQTPFFVLLRTVWIGNMLGRFLPSSAGGDAIKIYSFSQLSGQPVLATSSVVMDRITGSLSLVLYAAAGAVWSALMWGHPQVAYLVAGPLLVVTLVIGMIWNPLLRRGANRLGRLAWLPGRAFVWKTYEAVHAYARHPRHVMGALGISVVTQCCRVMMVAMVVRALGVPLTLGQCFVIVPSVILVGALPISIGGWGVQEGVYLYLLGVLGIGAASAVSIALLSRAVVMVGDVPALAMYLISGLAHREHRHRIRFVPKVWGMATASRPLPGHPR